MLLEADFKVNEMRDWKLIFCKKNLFTLNMAFSRIVTTNPASAEVLAEYSQLTNEQLASKIYLSGKGFQHWKTTSLAERTALLLSFADLLIIQKTRLAELMTREMGKRISEAKAEVEKCALCCRYYAEHGSAMLKPQYVKTEARESLVLFQPLGPVLAIMPWNFPLWQVVRFAAPALMAGNVVLLKHASNVSGTALELESLFREAGFPIEVFQTLLVSADRVENIIADEQVKAVTMTGSTEAGKLVAATAGKYLKKSVMELGGSDPFVVLADTNVEKAVKMAARARLINNGQSCIAAKRFIVEAPVYEDFVEQMRAYFSRLTMGDPMLIDTDLGPLARPDLAKELEAQVNQSVGQGALLLTGNGQADGAFFPATILADVKPGMAVFDEETFGPVAAICKASSSEHALSLANQSVFGLGASVWTNDERLAQYFIDGLEVGAVFVNDMVKSDPRLPFGGLKESGYGNELSSWGMYEFMNLKSVWKN